MKKIVSVMALALALQAGQGILAPQKANALIVGVLAGNLPLMVFGGLMIFPGSWIAGEYGPYGWAVLATGIILDSNQQPAGARLDSEIIAKICKSEGLSEEETARIQRDAGLIDQYIPASDPVAVDLTSLRQAKPEAYPASYSETARRMSKLLSDRINAEITKVGGNASIQIAEETARFILAINGII